MARKGLIQREKKRQKLEQKYHLIRQSSKKEISKGVRNGKFIESYNPHRGIVQLHAFIDVVLRPDGRELIIETLDYPDIYKVKWFMHLCCQEQEDRVGKD